VGYEGTDGLHTVFPTAKQPKRAAGAPRAKKGKKGKPPCKYGPRLPNGRCPTKPRATTTERTLAKVVGIKATSRGKLTVADRAERAVQGRLATYAAGAALAKGKDLARGARRTVVRLAGPGVKGTVPAGLRAIGKKSVTGAVGSLGFAGTLGLIALAGISSYAITTKILNVRRERRIARSESAALAADAYRFARNTAEAEQGSPLSAEQQKVLAASFKAQLAELGLSTTNLGGL